MEFQIEKGVPLPGKKALCAPRKSKYPFLLMRVGESFRVPSTLVKPPTVRVAASAFGKRYNRKYVTRTDAEGICVWRAA